MVEKTAARCIRRLAPRYLLLSATLWSWTIGVVFLELLGCAGISYALLYSLPLWPAVLAWESGTWPAGYLRIASFLVLCAFLVIFGPFILSFMLFAPQAEDLLDRIAQLLLLRLPCLLLFGSVPVLCALIVRDTLTGVLRTDPPVDAELSALPGRPRARSRPPGGGYW